MPFTELFSIPCAFSNPALKLAAVDSIIFICKDGLFLYTEPPEK